LVVDQNPTTAAPRVLRINSTTGDRSVLSGNGVGTGPLLSAYTATTIRILGGVIYLANGERLMSVNPANGNRTLLSGGGRGTGPTIVWPLSIAGSSTATSLVVLDELQPSGAGLGNGALIRVDLASGNRTVLSSNATPTGGRQFDGPYDMAYDSCDDTYYVLEPGYSPSTPPGRVFKVDGATGVRTLYADFLGARNWSLLLTPYRPFPYPGGGGGGGGHD
jgi:hypothetical protein